MGLFFPVSIHMSDLGINCIGTCCVFPSHTSLSSGECVSDAARLRTVEKGKGRGVEILDEGV